MGKEENERERERGEKRPRKKRKSETRAVSIVGKVTWQLCRQRLDLHFPVGQTSEQAFAIKMGNNFSRSLAEAAVSGDLRRLDELLLSVDAKKLKTTDADGWTPLHYASAAGDGAAVALLLSHEEEGKEAVGRRAKDGSTPLHLAASSGAGAAAVLQLLKAGAEADALDGKGRSPLVVAAASRPPSDQSQSSSSGAVVSALVAAGADAKRALPVS